MLKSNANFLKYLEFLDVTTEILPKHENQGFIIEKKIHSFLKATIFVQVHERIKNTPSKALILFRNKVN